jgi:hydrogenase maturation protein HypF
MVLHGAVQGVGFRPFVYRLANAMGIKGWVSNSSQGVFIDAESERNILNRFVIRLEKEKPPLAFIQGMETSFLDVVNYDEFEIRESNSDGEKSAVVLPDIATCPDCLEEIFDPRDRRYLYPFTNCTNCGPRFSIIKSLPYDRPNTTMQEFEMCEECLEEYENPRDRRFHAQPNACPKCGPRVELWGKSGTILSMHHDAILQAAESIRDGKIVALKGIGGFQLLVDARNDEAVKRLRARKHREEKPFALMFPSLLAVEDECEVSETEERLLLSHEAPIALLKRRKLVGSPIASSAAPRNPYVGAMLPYSPLHHILMREIDFPIVATSGNISDEPICIDEFEALEKLGGIAEVFLVNNRPIERHVDDSVVRVMAGRVQVIRRARGYAPFPIEVENASEDAILAVGGHLKNTIAVNSGKNVFISQHIGDLSTEESFKAFEKVIEDFKSLYEISPKVVAHDLHPDYLSTQYARKMIKGENLVETQDLASQQGIQHHFAHVASCMAENKLDGEVLGVSWDGTGYGEDGTVWGGEFLKTDGASYDRVATFRSFRLPGSSASVKEPRRTAVGLLYEIFGDELFRMQNLEPIKAFDKRSLPILKKMLKSGLNSPITTSAGRIFDAVSSILGLRQTVNFEGQGAMELEFALDGIASNEVYHFAIRENRNQETGDRKYYDPNFVIDWEQMVREIIVDKSEGVSIGLISAKFHNTLSEMILDIAKRVGLEKVVMSGGCFQNKYLTERTIAVLSENNLKPYWHQRVPPNDGGIPLGQIFVALNRTKEQEATIQRQEVKSKELSIDS